MSAVVIFNQSFFFFFFSKWEMRLRLHFIRRCFKNIRTCSKSILKLLVEPPSRVRQKFTKANNVVAVLKIQFGREKFAPSKNGCFRFSNRKVCQNWIQTSTSVSSKCQGWSKRSNPIFFPIILDGVNNKTTSCVQGPKHTQQK